MKTQSDWNKRYVDNDLPWDSGRPDENIVRLVRNSGITPCKALEIGCGTGTNAIWLAGQGFTVRGMDLAPLAIERARQKASDAELEIDFHALNILEDEIPGAPYGLVFDRGCFHSFDEAADQTAFVQITAQLLEENGFWFSLIGSCDGPPRELGPPRRSVAEITSVIEPYFEIRLIEAACFDSEQKNKPWAWLCAFRKRGNPPA